MVPFDTKMKTNVVPWHWRMKESYLDGDNFDIMTYSLHNVDCNYEHVMHRSLESCPSPLHGWKLGVHLCTCLKSSLHLIWNIIWHLCRRIVKYTIVMRCWTLTHYIIWVRLAITHYMRRINVSLIWWVTMSSLYTHGLKAARKEVLIKCCHPLLSPPFRWLFEIATMLGLTLLEPWSSSYMQHVKLVALVNVLNRYWHLDCCPTSSRSFPFSSSSPSLASPPL